MPISVTEMEVPFRLYRTADGDPAYENVVYLKRLSDDYALTVKVDNNTVKKTNLDGSYVLCRRYSNKCRCMGSCI